MSQPSQPVEELPPPLGRATEPLPHDVPSLSSDTENFIAAYVYECHQSCTQLCRRQGCRRLAEACESRLCLKTTTMAVTLLVATLLVWLYAIHRRD